MALLVSMVFIVGVGLKVTLLFTGGGTSAALFDCKFDVVGSELFVVVFNSGCVSELSLDLAMMGEFLVFRLGYSVFICHVFVDYVRMVAGWARTLPYEQLMLVVRREYSDVCVAD